MQLGTAGTYWLDTYLPVIGGIASWVAVIIYDLPRSRSVLAMLCAFSAFIPFLYAIYAILYLGVYAVYVSVFRSLSVWGIIFGIVCVALGYRMAYGLQGFTTPRQDAAQTG